MFKQRKSKKKDSKRGNGEGDGGETLKNGNINFILLIRRETMKKSGEFNLIGQHNKQ